MSEHEMLLLGAQVELPAQMQESGAPQACAKGPDLFSLDLSGRMEEYMAQLRQPLRELNVPSTPTTPTLLAKQLHRHSLTSTVTGGQSSPTAVGRGERILRASTPPNGDAMPDALQRASSDKHPPGESIASVISARRVE